MELPAREITEIGGSVSLANVQPALSIKRCPQAIDDIIADHAAARVGPISARLPCVLSRVVADTLDDTFVEAI